MVILKRNITHFKLHIDCIHKAGLYKQKLRSHVLELITFCKGAHFGGKFTVGAQIEFLDAMHTGKAGHRKESFH